MIVITFVTSFILLSIIGLLLYKLKVRPQTIGPGMTIVFDTNLHIKDIINPRLDILENHSLTSLRGLGLEKFLSTLTGFNDSHLKHIVSSFKTAVENRSEAFFEYPSELPNGKRVQTLCYAEFYSNNDMLLHFVRMGINERITGCGKCDDYNFALSMNDLPIGVYIRSTDLDSPIIFTNKMAKQYYGYEDITQHRDWDQLKESAVNSEIIRTREPVSFEQAVYDENGKPLRWYNLSKTLQTTNRNSCYITTTITDISEQKRRESELEIAKLYLGLAIGAGSVSVWHYNIKENTFASIYGEIYMSQSNNMEGFLKICHPDSIKIFTDAYDNLLSNKSQAEDITVCLWNDQTKTYDYVKSMMIASKSASGSVENIIGTQKNITEDYKQKVELKKAQKNLSLAMEAGGVSVWIYDIAQETFFTLQGDTIAGQGLTMAQNIPMMHPDDAIVCVEIMRAMAAGEMSTTSVIYRYKADDVEGGYRYYDARKIAVVEDGVIKFITGTQKEITTEHFYQKKLEESNRKATQAMQELQVTNKYNRLILDNSNSGLVYLSPDYVVHWENVSMMKTVTNYCSLFHEGQLCYNTFKDNNAPCPDCIMQKAMLSGKRESKEVTMKHDKIVNIMATPIYDNNQELEGVVLKLDDITEQKRGFKELQEAKEKAEISDRFKSTFLANMSHEIRTPLNAIVGFSELIADAETEKERSEYINIIATNNKLLLKLINDILDLSRMEAGFINLKNEPFNIDDLYYELSMTFSQLMPSGVKFICDKPGTKDIVNLDKNRLTQVITNFVNNAIKFTKIGSITMGYEIEDGILKIYISDTGIGIAKEKISNVFERFEKLNDFAQGTGLGLSICKSIIEAQNGTIGVDSTENKGSTFWAQIPCEIITDNQERLKILVGDNGSDREVATKYPKIKMQILVAEDTDSNFTLLHSMLRKNYELTRVLNGEEAVMEVQKNSYDAVFMDIKMPVMDGIEATKNIRELNKTLPIIALTASVFDSNRQLALSAGCNYFLTKPVDIKQLTALLSELELQI